MLNTRPVNEGDMGLLSGPGRRHMLRARTTTTEAHVLRTSVLQQEEPPQ